MKYNDIKIRCNCKILPPKGYSAITLFGTIYTRKNEEEVEEYLKTSRGQQWINHERIHMLQADTFRPSFMKWIFFYIVYLWQFFIAYPWTMSWKQAYKTICFEYEAYMNQENSKYEKSEWWKYIIALKIRKTKKI